MPNKKEPVSKVSAEERARELKELLDAQENGTLHFLDEQDRLTTRIPFSVTDARRIAELKRNVKEPKKRTQRAKRMSNGDHAKVAADRDLLTEELLAQRWLCSTSRLQHWRSKNQGPAYLKIGGRVLYRIADIQDFELKHLVRTSVSHGSV